jgi:hypothetical protein
MSGFIDLTGRIFGRLTVLSCAKRGGKAPLRWNCLCSCGAETLAQGGALKNGHTRSCGCLSSETAVKTHTTHGAAPSGARTKTYKVWTGMKYRCDNPNEPAWKDYGGRGIAVCERWYDFANFLADMGEKPEGWSIERTDNDGGYSPGNCVWADQRTQVRNRRNTLYITVRGERMPMIAACEQYGIKPHTVLVRRRRAGLSTTEAFFDVLDRKLHPNIPKPR